MTARIRRTLLTAAVLLPAFLLTACGGDADPGNRRADPADAATLKAGFAQADVTPLVPVMLAGYGAAFFSEDACRWSTGVHDPLYAQAMALEDAAGSAAILIVLDNVGTITNEIVEIQDGVSQAVGLAPDRVVVCSTHTHHGPDTIGLWGVIVPPISGRQEDVIDRMVQGAVRAGVDAWQARVPARLEYAAGEEPRMHFNKVFGDPERLMDSTLTVLAATDAQGRLLGSVMNWAAHPTLMPESNRLVSADYPGAYYRHMQERLGGVHLFVNGAIGASIQALAPEDGVWKWILGNATWDDVDAMGARLADDAVSLLAAATPVDEPVIGTFAAREVKARVDNLLFALAAQVGLIPREVPPLGEEGTTYMTTFAVGPVTFGSVPGEYVPDYSFAIRELMGGDAQMILGLGMDWIGYAITPAQYENPVYLYERSLCPSDQAGEELLAVYHEVWDPVRAR